MPGPDVGSSIDTNTSGTADYLSFLRGYAAAMNHDAADLASEPAAYSEGFVAASRPPALTVSYRELSIQHSSGELDSGSFNGKLHLPD